MAIVVAACGGSEAWFASLGVAGGEQALVRAGALTAAYSAAVEHARRSAAIFDSGRCSPRADEGIAVYKRRWGLRPAIDPLSPLIALRARTTAGKRFLASLPLWTLEAGPVLRRVGASDPADG
jgi:hypothetical protein